MIITNKSSVTLRVSGTEIAPNTSENFFEAMFNTTYILSPIGCCTITTEYGKRAFENQGDPCVKEGKQKDSHGLRHIVVTG